jgi:hypothetical protein
MAYQIALDIANRAIQHLVGVNRIYALYDDKTPVAKEIAFTYDKVRDAELRRNTWRFAIRSAVLRPITSATVLWTPPAWVAATTYAAGAVVNYTPTTLNTAEFGANPIPYLWYCDVPVAGSASNSAPDIATAWHRYFGPLTCEPFVSGDNPPTAPTLSAVVSGALAAATYYVRTTYITTTGETMPSGESSLAVAANSVLRVTSPAAQTGATAYHVYAGTTADEETLQTGTGAITIGTDWTEPTSGLVVGRGLPLAETNTDLPGFWAGEITVLNATVYTSLVSSNVDAPPSGKWLAQGGTVAPLNVLYPLGSGPSVNAGARNAFRLPAGFLRLAPSDLSADFNAYLGAPTGLPDEDWVQQGNYLISRCVGPLPINFVADVVDVYEFDSLFCEMVAARIATEVAGASGVCDRADVGPSKRDAMVHYFAERRQAYQANSVLQGRAATPLNRYIIARL